MRCDIPFKVFSCSVFGENEKREQNGRFVANSCHSGNPAYGRSSCEISTGCCQTISGVILPSTCSYAR